MKRIFGEPWLHALVFLLGLLPALVSAAWFNPAWNYRVPINVPAGASVNSTVRVDVDFNAMLSAMGVAGTFDVNSPRVVRPDDTLSAIQEFTDTVHAGATDAAGNGRGEIRFILQDAGPTTYYLYFDITANGPKAANPQMPINGNFERGGTGTATPPGWAASTRSNTAMDIQIRPSETVSVTDATTAVTDGTPNTGQFSYLIGYRSNADAVNSNATLTRTFTVPASNAGNISIRIKPQGWDSAVNGNVTQYDFIRVRLLNPTTSAVLLDIVGPQLNNYLTCPYSPNYRVTAITATTPGYGLYNHWDNGRNSDNHTLGMSAAYNRGQQPWVSCSVSLAAVAGQTVRLEIRTDIFNQFRTWFLLDDIEWSVVAASLGTPEGNVVVPGGFNAFETSTPAGSTSGVIRTKVAASVFGLDVVALNATGTAVETAFAGDVRVELVDAASGGACAGLPLIRNLGTLTFAAANAGRKTLAGISEPEAWPNVRVRMSYPASGTPTVIGCSNDNFAIRPASFGAVTASDTDSLTAGTARTLANTAASGGVVHRAGRPFRLAATALNAAGVTTSNYAGSPVANNLACVLPASGCVLGVLSTGTWSTAAGTAVTTTASYSEVGALSLRLEDAGFAAVDAADGSTLAERVIQSPVFSIGRFVPDHFELAPANTPMFLTFNDASCASRAFTYIGQPFGYATAPRAAISAKNATGATTQNYAGSLWKLAPAWTTQTYAAATGTLDTGLVGTPTVVETGAGTGTLAAHPDDVLAFVRTTPVAPFAASITLTMRVRDEAEAAVAGNGIIDTAAPALFADIAFDAGNAMRFGRLVLTNAHGAELLSLPVPIEAQYWDGSHFVRNVADACTRLAANQVALANWRRDLAPCETSVTLSGRFIAGRGNLRLSAPGAGNTGSVDLSVQLGATASGSTCVGGAPGPATPAAQPWLQGAWTGAAYDRNPAARASFGLFRGNRTLIYQREMY